MTADTVVRARIDGRVKQQAEDVLDKMGLSVSDAIRMLMTRIAQEKALPFEVRVPNAATATARGELTTGASKKFGDVSALMAELNADD